MNLKSRVAAHLRTGSVNAPGQDAINILASRMGCKKNDVKEALRELMAEGNLDLGGGTLQHASYIGISRADFRPRTQEGRRQQRHAVDQLGNHYRGTATGGPVITRQATLEEWVRMKNDPSEYMFGTPANDIQVQEATPIMDADVPKPADALGDEAQAQAAVPVVDAVYAELTKAGKQPKPNRKAPSVLHPRSVNKLAKVEELKVFIMAEVEKCADGLIPSEAFRLLAAEELGVSVPTISNYLRVLTDSSFVEYTRNGVARGVVYIKLVSKLSVEDKFNMVLELLRTLSRKRNSRLPLKDEIAALLKTTPGVAEVGYMQPMRKLDMYRTEKVEGPGLWKFKLVYVQPHPITQEQLAQIRAIRNSKHKPASQRVEPVTAIDTILVSEPVAAVMPPQPSIVLVESEPDEITQLVAGLVDANDVYASRVQELEAALAHQQDVNSSYVRMIQDLDAKVLTQEVMLEAERLRADVPKAPAKPALPEDLLARARAAIVTNKEQSSAPS